MYNFPAQGQAQTASTEFILTVKPKEGIKYFL